MTEQIKKIVFSFIFIATGTLLATTLFITLLLPEVTFGVELLWQILAFPLFTSPLILIFYSKKELSKKAIFIRQVLHYMLINIILIPSAYSFKWLETGNLIQLIIFIILVFMVYVGVCISSFVMDQKEATNLNQHIKAYQKRQH